MSFVYYQSNIYFFGGMQLFKGDSTGSFVYKLDLDTKEWDTVEYSGIFPASVPNTPYTGCR